MSGVDEDVFAIPGGSKKSKKNSNPPKTKSPSEDVIKFDWTQQQKFVTFYIYLKEPVKQVIAFAFILRYCYIICFYYYFCLF